LNIKTCFYLVCFAGKFGPYFAVIIFESK